METWFEEIYETNSDRIYRYLYMQVGDPDVAEDLTQETFIKAYRAKKDFAGKSSAYTWLYSIARHVSYDYFRKKRPLAFLPAFFQRQPEVEALPVDEALTIGEEAATLYDALGALKDHYREVILLRHIHELSVRETGEVLGWSESKVKSTLHRAMPALRSQMEKRGVTHETVRS